MEKTTIKLLQNAIITEYNRYTKAQTLKIDDAQKMIQDDVVSSSVESIRLALRGANYTIECEDVRQLEYLEELFSDNWGFWIDAFVDAMVYGYNFNEVIYSLDGLWYPTEYRDTDLRQIEILRDEEGNTVGFKNTITRKEFSLVKSMWMTWNATFRNPYGRSFLKPAYDNWNFKRIIQLSMVNCSQNTGEPPFKIEHPQRLERDGVDTKDVNREVAVRIAEDLPLNKFIIIPSVPDGQPKWTFEQIPMQNNQETFIPLLKQQETAIYRALLMPDTLFSSGNAGTGSYALSGTQAELRAQFLDGIGKALINSLLDFNTGLVNHCLGINFGAYSPVKISIESFDNSSQAFYRSLIEKSLTSPLQIPIDLVAILEGADIPIDENFIPPMPIMPVFSQKTFSEKGDNLVKANNAKATRIDNTLQSMYDINKSGIVKTAYDPLVKWLSDNSKKFYNQNKDNPRAFRLDIPEKYINTIANQWDTVLMSAFMYGNKFVNDMAARKMSIENDILQEWWDKTPEQVIEIFAGLGVYPPDPENILNVSKRKAFTLAIANNNTIAKKFQDGLVRAISEGMSATQWVEYANNTIVPSLGIDVQSDFYMKLVYRNNTASVFAAGQYSAYADPFIKQQFPAWQYNAVGDDRTRPEHYKNNGVVLPIDDPWWDYNYPPNGHNCRCYVIQVHKSDLSSIPKKQSYGNSFDTGWNQHVGREWVGNLT